MLILISCSKTDDYSFSLCHLSIKKSLNRIKLSRLFSGTYRITYKSLTNIRGSVKLEMEESETIENVSATKELNEGFIIKRLEKRVTRK